MQFCIVNVALDHAGQSEVHNDLLICGMLHSFILAKSITWTHEIDIVVPYLYDSASAGARQHCFWRALKYGAA